MNRIYWDAMLFAYFFEAHPLFGPRVRQIHQVMARRGNVLCTSIFTVAEVLTGPEKTKSFERVKIAKDYFQSGDVELIPFTFSTAETFAKIRASNSLLPADAIHLASAAESKADLFITNDKQLQRLNIPGIKFIAGLDGKLI